MCIRDRFYGDLQGLNKDECREKWGEETVQIWRRSYDKGPPGGETLKETGERVLPYYFKEIHPLILKNMNVLVAAHGNSLRSLIKYLDNMSDEDIVKLEIPTGAPIHYSFDESGKVIIKINIIKKIIEIKTKDTEKILFLFNFSNFSRMKYSTALTS